MLPKAVAVAVLSSVAIAAGGCSGDPDVEAEGLPPTTTERVETEPSKQPRLDVAKFRAAFKKRFATAPSALLWYDHVTGMEVVDGNLEIATDLEPEKTLPGFSLNYDNATAREICGAGMGFALESAAGDGITGVIVKDSAGVGLAGCA